MRRNAIAGGMLSAVLLLAAGLGGCGKGRKGTADVAPPEAAASAAVAETGQMVLCDYKGGPEDAPVKVVAFYPGRHEDTLAAVKALMQKFPERVSVEVVDWRSKEGAARRDQAGLSCAGITINGKNAFDIQLEGKSEKVMFIRGMNGDWTEAQLLAAVESELDAVAKPQP